MNLAMLFPQKIKDDHQYTNSIEFFQKLLRTGTPCKLEEEYPLVFRSEFKDRVFIKQINGEIVAGLGTLERLIEIEKDRRIRALFVGSVVTDPQRRLQGFQRELFHAVEEYAENEGLDLIVLWSSQLEFYEKLGFELAGMQATWMPQSRPKFDRKNHEVRMSRSRELPLSENHFRAFCAKTHRVDRSFDEMKHLWRIPKMWVASTENAYALLGKGEDFSDVCHEWAGPAEEVLACLDRLYEHEPRMKVMSPGVLHIEDERNVVSALEARNFECRLEYLGLIKSLKSKIKMQDFQPDHLKYPFFIWGLDSI